MLIFPLKKQWYEKIKSGEKTIEELGDELFEVVKDVIAGRKSKAEALGFNDMSLARECNFC